MLRPLVGFIIASVLCLAGRVAAEVEDGPPLSITISPSSDARVLRSFDEGYVPLSDGAFIDFAGWMAHKYGLSGWRSRSVVLDQITGRTALTVYGLDRVLPSQVEPDRYTVPVKLPGCGGVSALLFGAGAACEANWQSSHRVATGGVLTPQMVGFVDFNTFAAITPADQELGIVRLGAPPVILSLVAD